MDRYGDIHRAFLQTMISRKIVKWSEAEFILTDLCSLAGQKLALQQVIDKINHHVRDMKMELRNVVCEVTKTKYCLLAITVETYVARFSSGYSRNEKELLLKIMEEIITSGNSHAYLNSCINLSSKLPETMSKSNAETVIRRFIRDMWLIEGKDGLIYLGPRCISELEPIIRDIYCDYIGDCIFCEKLVVAGEACSSCSSRVHSYCLERYKSGQTGNRYKCFKCTSEGSDSDGSTVLDV